VSGSQLRVVGVGVDHTTFPMPFAIKVTHEGDAPAYVDDAQIFVATKTLLYDDEAARGSVPDGFDCAVIVFDEPGADGALSPLPKGKTIEVAPGATVDIRGAVEWVVPANAPPMLAIVRASFAAMRNGKSVAQSDERLYVLQSREGAVEAVRNTRRRRTAARVAPFSRGSAHSRVSRRRDSANCWKVSTHLQTARPETLHVSDENPAGSAARTEKPFSKPTSGNPIAAAVVRLGDSHVETSHYRLCRKRRLLAKHAPTVAT
jgi:hypothetical protein